MRERERERERERGRRHKRKSYSLKEEYPSTVQHTDTCIIYMCWFVVVFFI